MGLSVISGVVDVVAVEVLVLVDVVVVLVVVQTGDVKSKTSMFGPPDPVEAVIRMLFDPAAH